MGGDPAKPKNKTSKVVKIPVIRWKKKPKNLQILANVKTTPEKQEFSKI